MKLVKPMMSAVYNMAIRLWLLRVLLSHLTHMLGLLFGVGGGKGDGASFSGYINK